MRDTRSAPVSAVYQRLTDMNDVATRIAELSLKTVIFDIEPLVAYWNSAQDELDQGVRHIIREFAVIPGLRVVCFATNSARQVSAIPQLPGLQVKYLASAGKPFRTAAYLGFPQPGAVVGDQILTDGMLARRLGFTFLHCTPSLRGAPLGPQLLNRFGNLLRPLLFAEER
jgi:predicted HAD superfamily phosphohydrolase YqeG